MAAQWRASGSCKNHSACASPAPSPRPGTGLQHLAAGRCSYVLPVNVAKAAAHLLQQRCPGLAVVAAPPSLTNALHGINNTGVHTPPSKSDTDACYLAFGLFSSTVTLPSGNPAGLHLGEHWKSCCVTHMLLALPADHADDLKVGMASNNIEKRITGMKLHETTAGLLFFDWSLMLRLGVRAEKGLRKKNSGPVLILQVATNAAAIHVSAGSSVSQSPRGHRWHCCCLQRKDEVNLFTG